MRPRDGMYWFYLLVALTSWVVFIWALFIGDSWKWAVFSIAVNLASGKALESYR